jgi:glycosyltransferase involved in cell wall biosynthesis
MLHIPVVVEVCEAPWKIRNRKGNFIRFLPLLAGVSGVIAISKFLVDWSSKEGQKHKQRLSIFQLPILTEIPKNIFAEARVSETPSVLLASSKDYGDTVSFVLKAMQIVWEKIPNCVLVVTGTEKHRQLVEDFLSNAKLDRSKVVVTEYLSREDLFINYKRSWALLIPLFNDVRSIARFPTKIAEYLSTSRPIVTTNIGEISSYFVDGVNAFVAQDDSIESFGRKVLEALLSADKAEYVGKNGFQTCQTYFDYRKYSEDLFTFFESVQAGSKIPQI